MLEHARRITSNASRLLVGELGNRALRFIALLVMARYLSVTDFGIVNVAIAVSGILLVVTSLGLPDQGSREVAATPGKAGWLLGRISTIRVLTLTLVGAAGCVIMLIVSDGGLDIALLIVAMALMMALSADWLSRGLERMGTIAFASLGGGLVMVLGTLALAAAGGDVITTMLLFTCAEAVLTAILAFRQYAGVPVIRGHGHVQPAASGPPTGILGDRNIYLLRQRRHGAHRHIPRA